jgi:hypothetical protein
MKQQNTNLISNTLKQTRIGEIRSHKSLHVAPILSNNKDYQEYITLHQASKDKLVEFTETSDVSSASISNLSTKPLFIMNGEILEGAKQNRVINDSIIIPKNSTKTVDVSCVEEGRWSNIYKGFKHSDEIFNMRSRWEKSKSVFDTKMRTGSRKSDQSKVWDEIRTKQSRMGVHSRTYSAKDTYLHYQNNLHEYEKQLMNLPDQVGLIFYLDDNYIGIDLFDSPRTFKEFSKKILRSIAIDAIEIELNRRITNHPQIALKLLNQFIELMRNLKEESIAAPYLGREVVMNYPRLNIFASATSTNDQIIHLNGYHQIDFAVSKQSVH